MKKIMIFIFLLVSIIANANIKYIMESNKKLSEKEAFVIDKVITEFSIKHKVNKKLILAVAKVESNFRKSAESKAGAYGIMQIMPITAKHFEMDRTVLEENIEIGVLHLKEGIEEFGLTDLAIASYNAGITKVKNKNYKTIPETRYYVAKVLKELDKLGLRIKQDKKTIKKLEKELIENTPSELIENDKTEEIEKTTKKKNNIKFEVGGLGFKFNE